jgi:hypothetical protein
MLDYARVVTSELGNYFKEQGIRNPSTADDTPRDISFMRTMLFPPYPETSLVRRIAKYTDNALRLGCLLTKDVANRLT